MVNKISPVQGYALHIVGRYRYRQVQARARVDNTYMVHTCRQSNKNACPAYPREGATMYRTFARQSKALRRKAYSNDKMEYLIFFSQGSGGKKIPKYNRGARSGDWEYYAQSIIGEETLTFQSWIRRRRNQTRLELRSPDEGVPQLEVWKEWKIPEVNWVSQSTVDDGVY